MKHNLKHNDNLILWGIVFILGIITCIPLLNFGTSNMDDLCYLIMVKGVAQGSSYKSILSYLFLAQGRLTHLLTGWSAIFPYLFQSHFLYLLIAVGPIIADLILTAVLTKRWTGNETVAIASAMLLFAFFPLNTDYTACNGYPFSFSFSFMLLLVTLIWLVRYMEKQQYHWLILSAIMMFLTTAFYEVYMLYYILIYLILRSQYASTKNLIQKHLRKFVKELLPYILFGLIFVITYCILAHIYGGSYSGNKFSVEPRKTLQTLFNLSLYTLPGMSFFQNRIFLADFSTNPKYIHSLSYILTHTGVTSWCKGLVTLLLFIGVIRQWDFQSSAKRLWYALILSLLATVLPHLLISCSEKYTLLIPDSYVTSYFAFFGMVMFVLISYIIIRQHLKKTPTLLTLFNLLFGGLLLFITVLTQFTNEQIMEDIKRANFRYSLVDEFSKESGIDFCQNNMATYVGRYQYSPTLCGSRMSIPPEKNFFSPLAKGKFEINYEEFYNKYKFTSDTVAILAYQQAAKSDDIYFVYILCKGSDLAKEFTQSTCDRMTVAYYSAYKTFALSIGAQDDSTDVLINGQPLRCQGGIHYANIRFLSKPKLQIFTLSGAKTLPGTLLISNILYPGITPIDFGRLPENYLNDGLRFYQHALWKNRPYCEYLRQEAKRRGVNPEQFIKENASWLVLYHHQY